MVRGLISSTAWYRGWYVNQTGVINDSEEEGGDEEVTFSHQNSYSVWFRWLDYNLPSCKVRSNIWCEVPVCITE